MKNLAINTNSGSSVIEAAKRLIEITGGRLFCPTPAFVSRARSEDADVQPQAPRHRDEYDGRAVVGRDNRKRRREAQESDGVYRSMLRQRSRGQNQVLEGYMKRLDVALNPRSQSMFLPQELIGPRGNGKPNATAERSRDPAQKNQEPGHLGVTQAMLIDCPEKIQEFLLSTAHSLTVTVGRLQDEISVMRAQIWAMQARAHSDNMAHGAENAHNLAADDATAALPTQV